MAAQLTSPKTQIFISYKRNVEPDHSLSARVFEALQGCGYSVFIDLTLTVGQEWAKAIEEKVRRSDFLIVFLTPVSSASEMVKGELEIARDEAAKTGNRPRILPVRLAFTGSLPYPVSAWLDPLQYALWRGDRDTDRLIQDLTAAIAGSDLPAPPMVPETTPLRLSPPLYSAPLPAPGGGLDVDDPWYIDRGSDAEAGQTIAQQGVTLVIKGSRQMGKTSLLVRTLSSAMELGKRCALIDFQMLGQESLVDSTTFFRRFGSAVGESLEVDDILTSWQAGLADSQNLTKYMEKEVLGRIDAPVVLAIDEADFLFQASFLYDFFGMLRAWHNRRANPFPATKKLWKKLDLVLVTSTEPYLFIERDHESPFNVGEVVRLSDFTLEQVRELNVRHQSPLFAGEVDTLYNLLHGQPYLTRKAFYVIKAKPPNGLTPDQLFDLAAEDCGPFGDHLRNYFLRLLNYPKLAAALKDVTLGRGCADPKLAYRLEGAGLVKTDAGKTVPRCSLYEKYFRDRL